MLLCTNTHGETPTCRCCPNPVIVQFRHLLVLLFLHLVHLLIDDVRVSTVRPVIQRESYYVCVSEIRDKMYLWGPNKQPLPPAPAPIWRAYAETIRTAFNGPHSPDIVVEHWEVVRCLGRPGHIRSPAHSRPVRHINPSLCPPQWQPAAVQLIIVRLVARRWPRRSGPSLSIDWRWWWWWSADPVCLCIIFMRTTYCPYWSARIMTYSIIVVVSKYRETACGPANNIRLDGGTPRQWTLDKSTFIISSPYLNNSLFFGRYEIRAIEVLGKNIVYRFF